MDTPVRYRWIYPNMQTGWATKSTGIEPFRESAKGRNVKAGPSVVRIVVHRDRPDTLRRAEEIAEVLLKGLNEGGTYQGPKTVDTLRHMHTDVSAWLTPANHRAAG